MNATKHTNGIVKKYRVGRCVLAYVSCWDGKYTCNIGKPSDYMVMSAKCDSFDEAEEMALNEVAAFKSMFYTSKKK